jgi:universal stress protein E
MNPIRKILFAIKDPFARRQPGLAKAIELAEGYGASLELFHALSSPVFVGLEPLLAKPAPDLERDVLGRTRKRLESIAAAGLRRGADISCHVAWDYPPHEAILRRATRTHTDLIVAECHQAGPRLGWLMRHADWELLRLSKLPVLLLRSSRRYREPVVLAAVDPSHRHAKPIDLDAGILAGARSMARALQGSVHAVHVCEIPAMPVLGLDPSTNPYSLVLDQDAFKKQARREFMALMSEAGVPARHRHLVYGDPAKQIPLVTRTAGAAIVAMGAISRSGLKRLFIGNTAEKILDDLPADVLVMKPASFSKQVSARTRGMRVLRTSAFSPLPA